jgi:hypothetical protein
MIHIYSAKEQPATRYKVGENEGRPSFIVRNSPRRLLYCHQCKRRRWAKYLIVQVYYDMTAVWCKPGHGCRSKEVS